jgi:hypothetical protein
MITSLRSFRYVTAVVTAAALLAATPLVSIAAETGIPPFIQAGKTYKMSFGGQDVPVTVIELVGDGWIKAKLEGQVQWINLRKVICVIPVS